MSNECKMLADIVADVRQYVANTKIPPEVAETINCYIDRIEAAWNLEARAIATEHAVLPAVCITRPSGNAHETWEAGRMNTNEQMRAALIQCELFLSMIDRHAHPTLVPGDKCVACKGAEELRTLVNAALTLPRRNCDVGTAEEQAVRFRDMCNKYYDDENPCNKKCPMAAFEIIRGWPRCQSYWTQMPYEAQEGGAQ